MGNCIGTVTGVQNYNSFHNKKLLPITHTHNISGQVVNLTSISDYLFNLVTTVYFKELPIVDQGMCKKSLTCNSEVRLSNMPDNLVTLVSHCAEILTDNGFSINKNNFTIELERRNVNYRKKTKKIWVHDNKNHIIIIINKGRKIIGGDLIYSDNNCNYRIKTESNNIIMLQSNIKYMIEQITGLGSLDIIKISFLNQK